MYQILKVTRYFYRYYCTEWLLYFLHHGIYNVHLQKSTKQTKNTHGTMFYGYMETKYQPIPPMYHGITTILFWKLQNIPTNTMVVPHRRSQGISENTMVYVQKNLLLSISKNTMVIPCYMSQKCVTAIVLKGFLINTVVVLWNMSKKIFNYKCNLEVFLKNTIVTLCCISKKHEITIILQSISINTMVRVE